MRALHADTVHDRTQIDARELLEQTRMRQESSETIRIPSCGISIYVDFIFHSAVYGKAHKDST